MPTRTLNGRRTAAVIRFRRPPKGRFALSIFAGAADGRHAVAVRRHRTCAK
jgi:hypothetical protein